LKYRVQVATTPDELLAGAASAGPMLILMDLVSKRADICDLIKQLRATPATAHLPIIAFADETEVKLQSSATEVGATLVVTDAAIIPHLNQFIQQALQVE